MFCRFQSFAKKLAWPWRMAQMTKSQITFKEQKQLSRAMDREET